MNLPELSKTKDDSGHVDFLVNKTRAEYIKLEGINTACDIGAVHDFLCQQEIWNKTDSVIKTLKTFDYEPPRSQYHDISFIMKFYEYVRLNV